MIKRNHCYLFIIALGLLISNVQASTLQDNKHQSADQIMENASSLFTSKGGVSILFKMVTHDNKSLVVATNQGLLQMDSLKYMLKTDVSQSWYDGATQWSYLTDTEEVNILSPSNAELLESNPYLFIFSYKDLFNAKLLSDFVFTGSSKTNSSLNFIEFIPKSKDYPYQKIVLGIDKFSYEMNQMDIFMTDGHVMNLTVQQFKTGIQYSKKTFQFVKGLLPDAEIIDLR
ncbi:MAG: LolA-like putative outer membrane lipoprotein chaperone [Bacteroidaceae bacterium]